MFAAPYFQCSNIYCEGFMLEHNCFQFLGVNYQQIRGTSMGAPWAPSYACLHLGLWEDEVVYASSMYLSHCRLWLRYMDDVIMIWGGGDTPGPFCLH